MSAKRWVRVRGSRAAAGVPVRAAQPLRPSPAPSTMNQPCVHPDGVVARLRRKTRRSRPLGSGSSSAFRAPQDCSAAGRAQGHADVGSAHTQPAAVSPRLAQRRAAYSPRSCPAPRSGSCRRRGTAGWCLRTKRHTGHQDSSRLRPSCAPIHVRTALDPAEASSDHIAGSD